jgi:hypothetical protein
MTVAVPTASPVPPEEVDRRVALVDGAMALAGHHVTDPYVRDLMRRVAAEEMTDDEAVALAVARHHAR